jgi:hypothetical protein
MKCNETLGATEPCGIERSFPSMKLAGQMVGIDLEKPIDCSQMDVREVSAWPDEHIYSRQRFFKRTTVLRAFVINEEGEREEIEITFELKSVRLPKITIDEATK